MYSYYLFFSFLILKHGTNGIFFKYLTGYYNWDSSKEEEDLCQEAIEQGDNKKKKANFDDHVS